LLYPDFKKSGIGGMNEFLQVVVLDEIEAEKVLQFMLPDLFRCAHCGDSYSISKIRIAISPVIDQHGDVIIG
jgi:hypothetical protein